MKFFEKNYRTSVLLVGRLIYPRSGLLVASTLGFKARVDPLFACFVVCMLMIAQIHQRCDI